MNSSASAPDLERWKQRIGAARCDLGQSHMEPAAFAALVDDLVRILGQRSGWDRAGNCLVALGGYGRAEMAPQSDIDLLFLVRRDTDAAAVDGVLYPLWDLGFDVGHALRTPQDCAHLAAADLTAATALLDGRVLLGDADLLPRAQRKAGIRPGGSRETRSWVPKIIADVGERRHRFGEVSHLLEPHIKEGRGGLRDLQASRWVLRCLGDDTPPSLLGPDDAHGLDAAVTFLNHTRNALHAVAGRKTDHLTFELHQEVAAQVMPGAPLHRFFEQLHRASHRVVATWEAAAAHAQQALLPKRKRAVLRRLPDRPELIRDAIVSWLRCGGELPDELRRVFVEGEPAAVGSAVVAAAAHVLRTRLPLAPLLFELHALERLGLFSRDLETVAHQVHYDARHAFTTGVHAIESLRAFENLWLGNLETKEPHLTRIVGAILHPGVVRVAALAHDLGKASGTTRHEQDSAVIARTLALKLGFEVGEADEAAHLVAHHHVIPRIAFGEDLEDPAAWETGRAAAGSNAGLDALVALAFADLIATNPHVWSGVWSDWKRDLLLHLHAHARDANNRGLSRGTRLRDTVEEISAALGLPGTAHIWDSIPPRQAEQMPPDLLAHLLGLAHSLGDTPARWHVETQTRGTTEILGVTQPLPRVLSSSTDTLTHMGLNILAFQMHTWADGTTHLWFRVAPPSAPLAASILATRLTDGLVGTANTAGETRPALLNRRAEAIPVETRVRLLPGDNPFYTVLEVRCRDRRGLIRDFAHLFENLGLTVEHALVTTHGPMAQDTFHLKDIFGGRVDGATKRSHLVRGAEEVAQQPRP